MCPSNTLIYTFDSTLNGFCIVGPCEDEGNKGGDWCEGNETFNGGVVGGCFTNLETLSMDALNVFNYVCIC